MKKKTIYISAAVFVFLLLITIIVTDPFQELPASDLDGAVEPTTAVLKSVDVGPPYLRLEQVRPEVIARFMLVLDVNYPDRSATTILAGGSGG